MKTILLAASVLCFASSACEPSPLQKARDAKKAGDLRAAAEFYGAAATASPDDKVMVVEAHESMRSFVSSAAAGKDSGSQQPAYVDAALRIAGQLGDDMSTRVLWGVKSQQAEKSGDISGAISAARTAYPATSVQDTDEAVAKIIQRNPKYPDAGKQLDALEEKHPASAPICIARAYWRGDQRQYAEAVAEYGRCTGLDNQSMEQALYIGAQRAVLQAYMKKEGAAAKGGKAKRHR